MLRERVRLLRTGDVPLRPRVVVVAAAADAEVAPTAMEDRLPAAARAMVPPFPNNVPDTGEYLLDPDVGTIELARTGDRSRPRGFGELSLRFTTRLALPSSTLEGRGEGRLHQGQEERCECCPFLKGKRKKPRVKRPSALPFRRHAKEDQW